MSGDVFGKEVLIQLGVINPAKVAAVFFFPCLAPAHEKGIDE